MVLCDTNIFIEVYRHNIAVSTELEKIGQENIAVSDITCGELLYGAINKAELRLIRNDLDNVRVLHIDVEISEMAVSLVDKYCLSHKLDIVDALIASTAIYYDIELFTLNTKDFKFIPQLRLYNLQ